MFPMGQQYMRQSRVLTYPLNDESVIVLNGITVDMNTPLKEGDMVTAFSAIAGG